jgi:preprotein translocase subunit SecY
LMWIGELISQRGIGNGMSMMIFASVVSGLPYNYYSLLQSK